MPLLEEAPHQTGHWIANQLDRNALLELSVGSLAEVDLSHSAFADGAHDAKRSDVHRRFGRLRPLKRECPEVNGGGVQNASRAAVGAQQLQHLGTQGFVIATHPVDEGGLLGRRNIEYRVEDGIDTVKTVVRGCGHSVTQILRRMDRAIVGATLPTCVVVQRRATRLLAELAKRRRPARPLGDVVVAAASRHSCELTPGCRRSQSKTSTCRVDVRLAADHQSTRGVRPSESMENARPHAVINGPRVGIS
jgi:hypothetical protein